MLLQEKYVQVSRAKIFYLEGGNQFTAKGTRIFLHGWGLTSRAFEKSIERLSGHYHILALDLPGFGRSNSPASFLGYEAYAQFVDAFLETLNVKKAHLIGQSMGGAICMATGALFASRVQSLVLLNSAGIPMPTKPSLKVRVKEMVEQSHCSGYRFENWPILNSFIYNSVWNLPFLTRSIRLPVQHDVRSLLPRIQVPCLLAWGQNDAMLPVSVAYELQKHLSQSTVVVLKEGHHEWGAVYPEKLLSLVTQFYAEHGL